MIQQIGRYFFAGASLLPATALTPDPTTEAVVLMTVPATDTVVETTASATAITAQPCKTGLSVSTSKTDRTNIA